MAKTLEGFLSYDLAKDKKKTGLLQLLILFSFLFQISLFPLFWSISVIQLTHLSSVLSCGGVHFC